VQTIASHRDLIVWQKAMDMVVDVYRLTSFFPKVETYRLTSQVTRSAVSVPANIAEGHSRGSAKEYAYYLAIAKGSLMETETYLMLAIRLGYLTSEETEGSLARIVEISKMLTAIRKKLC
jgi:four helix bundle protein